MAREFDWAPVCSQDCSGSARKAWHIAAGPNEQARPVRQRPSTLMDLFSTKRRGPSAGLVQMLGSLVAERIRQMQGGKQGSSGIFYPGRNPELSAPRIRTGLLRAHHSGDVGRWSQHCVRQFPGKSKASKYRTRQPDRNGDRLGPEYHGSN